MDICTLSTVVMTNLVACFTPGSCSVTADGTKEYCSGPQQASCNIQPSQYYDCIRPDGSKYSEAGPPMVSVNSANSTLAR